MRRQDALGNAQVIEPFHFGQPLQRRFARMRDFTHIFRRGDIAFRQPGIIMRRANQTIEIGFVMAHSLHTHARGQGFG